MPSRQYMFVEKKKKDLKTVSKGVGNHVYMECMKHYTQEVKRKELRAKQSTPSPRWSADLTRNRASRVSQWR